MSGLLYSSHRHSSLSLGRHRTPIYVPAPFDDLSTADESWQSGIMFEGTGARYREEWAARVLPVVIISNTNTSFYWFVKLRVNPNPNPNTLTLTSKNVWVLFKRMNK